MKKFSLSRFSLMIVIAATMTMTSCSKKYGCFYSLSTEAEKNKIEYTAFTCSDESKVDLPESDDRNTTRQICD